MLVGFQISFFFCIELAILYVNILICFTLLQSVRVWWEKESPKTLRCSVNFWRSFYSIMKKWIFVNFLHHFLDGVYENGGKMYNCDICHVYSFVKKSNLDKHLIEKHGIKPGTLSKISCEVSMKNFQLP